MKLFAIVLLALGATLPLAAQQADTSALAQLRAAVRARAAADEFSGVVLVAYRGRPVYQEAFGQANRERGTANTMDTRFNLGSGDKLFTKIAIRQLEQAGRLSLRDTLGKFLPDYPNAVARSRVTIEQLLAHRSGIGSYWNEGFRASRTRLRELSDVVPLFANDSLLFEPGIAMAYSNGGYVLLGRIVEVVSGMSYYDYMRRYVFGPARMSRTEYLTLDQWPADRAIGYSYADSVEAWSGDRRLAGPGAGPRPAGPGGPGAPQPPSGAPGTRGPGGPGRRPGAVLSPNNWTLAYRGSAAGGGYTTVGDLLLLDNALREGRVLPQAVADAIPIQMMTPGGPRTVIANGGSQGVNFEFNRIGDYTVIVLSNYDPPSAGMVGGEAQRLLGR